jgi:hypothetical protein
LIHYWQRKEYCSVYGVSKKYNPSKGPFLFLVETVLTFNPIYTEPLPMTNPLSIPKAAERPEFKEGLKVNIQRLQTILGCSEFDQLSTVWLPPTYKWAEIDDQILIVQENAGVAIDEENDNARLTPQEVAEALELHCNFTFQKIDGRRILECYQTIWEAHHSPEGEALSIIREFFYQTQKKIPMELVYGPYIIKRDTAFTRLTAYDSEGSTVNSCIYNPNALKALLKHLQSLGIIDLQEVDLMEFIEQAKNELIRGKVVKIRTKDERIVQMQYKNHTLTIDTQNQRPTIHQLEEGGIVKGLEGILSRFYEVHARPYETAMERREAPMEVMARIQAIWRRLMEILISRRV